VPAKQVVQFSVCNMGNQKLLYKWGMRPVFKSDCKTNAVASKKASIQKPIKTLPKHLISKSHDGWRKTTGLIRFSPTSINEGVLHFEHRFADGNGVYFAFCYPYSYEDCLSKLSLIESRLNNNQHSIYVHREALTTTLEGRVVDLLTITNDNIPWRLEHEIFENTGLLKNDDCRHYPNKPIVFVSSRVHPGETPASFMFDGFLDFILDRENENSNLLRDYFVFKMVPMLNPDGVAMGNYRCDSRGVNLNRVYDQHNELLYPSIAAVTSLVHAYKDSLFLYLDMHAHATKRGLFLFGNWYEDLEQQAEAMLFSKLISLHSKWFSGQGCDFSLKNSKTKDKKDPLMSKQGCGRVVMSSMTKVSKCFTLETNYHIGKDEYNINEYDPDVWREVGRDAALSLLATQQVSPQLLASEYKSIDGLKLQLMTDINRDRMNARLARKSTKKK